MDETTFKPTELLWDEYIDYLVIEIINSNFSRRAENKPMSTPKGPEDSHLTSRFMHELLTALIAKRIAKELETNENYAFTGMLKHDAGHPFSAHEGEVIFNTIGRIYNTGYFHHNAKGVEVILSEDICNKAIDRIPDIENHPKIRKQLQEEFYRFLDIVISHDGEATKADADKETVEYPSIKDAVLTKLQQSNSENKYKHIAQDTEGKLGKISDVLAYLPTDIQDGFRLGLITDFNDEYLEAFGEMFSEDENLSTEEKIAIAKSKINEIKIKYLREGFSSQISSKDQTILQYVNETLKDAEKEAKQKGKSINEILTPEFIKSRRALIESELRNNNQIPWNDLNEQMLMSDLNKYEEFIEKMLQVNTNVVKDITNKMQEYFINDIISNSKKTGTLSFSPKVNNLFYKMKELNYKYIVQYSRWDYQTKVQPKAAKKMVDLCASGLIKSGTIRDKLYDSSIRDCIKDEEALKYMRTKKRRKESKYEKFKRKIKKPQGKKTEYKKSKEKKMINRNILIGKVMNYTREKTDSFARTYMNVFHAIPHTVRENVECALEDEIKCKDYLLDFQVDSNRKIRNKMIDLYGSIEEAKKHKDEFIEMLVAEERCNMEKKMAIQLSIDYISGMTDRSFNEAAIKTGFVEREKIINAQRKGGTSSNVQKHLAALQQATESEETHNGKSAVGPTGPNGSGESR